MGLNSAVDLGFSFTDDISDFRKVSDNRLRLPERIFGVGEFLFGGMIEGAFEGCFRARLEIAAGLHLVFDAVAELFHLLAVIELAGRCLNGLDRGRQSAGDDQTLDPEGYVVDHPLAVRGLLLEAQPFVGLFKQFRGGVRVGYELASLVEGRDGGFKIVVLHLMARGCVERLNPFEEDPLP